jgi:glycosyl transferase family 87
MRFRAYLVPLLVACSGALLVAWDGLLTPSFTDYEIEAEPAFDLLRGGHLHAFLSHAPAYGGSLILRAPFVYAVTLWHAGGDAAFRASAVPAIIASIVLSLVLFGRLRGPGAWLALALCAANPLTLASYEIGHPEELLGAVLCVGAMLAALRNHALWAGLMVGVAVANKPWAALAVLPVVLALDHGRMRALVMSAVACAIVLAPLQLAGGHSLSDAAASAHQTGSIFLPCQIWWFFGSGGHVVMGLTGPHPDFRAAPAWLSSIAHPLVIVIGVALSALWWRVRARGVDRRDALGLLTLVMLARCIFDPWNVVYYELPFVIALLAWEVELRRPPIAALVATLLTWTTFELVVRYTSPDGQAAMFLLWALPMLAALALRVYAPARFAALCAPAVAALRRQLPSLVAALGARREPHPG